MKKRIAYLFEFPTVNGGENSILEFIRRLDRNRYEPLAFVPGPGPLMDCLKKAQVTVVEHSIQGLSDLIHKFTPDLLHANSLSMACLSGPLGKTHGIPSIGHIRDMLRIGSIKKARLLQNNVIISVSKACTEWLVTQGIHRQKIQTVYNGIDTAYFDPDKSKGVLRKKHGLSENHILIGTIGQIILRKGLDCLVEAIPKILRKHPQALFFLIGGRFSEKQETKEYERNLHTQIDRLGLENRVFWAGVRHDIPEILKDLDILAHPARQEPLGRVLLEALAMEVPVVATHVGGTPEIVTDGDVGLLVPAGDANALAKKIGILISDPLKRKCMGQAGRKKIQKVFSSEGMTEATSRCYESILDDPKLLTH